MPPARGALAAAAVTLRAPVALRVPVWTLIGQITHGRLLAAPAPRPEFMDKYMDS
jgi:hypothetical protein